MELSDRIPNPDDFDISIEYGFLLENPLVELPIAFDAWNRLALHLPSLLKTKSLRDQVQKLPLLNHNELTNERELRCAHLFLSTISHAYIWQEGDCNTPEILPRQLAIPWCGVSDRLRMKPIICHASLVLANWKTLDPSQPTKLGNIESILFLENTKASDWFNMVTWQVEKDFVPAIQAIICAMRSVVENDVERLCGRLQSLSLVIETMRLTLSRMHDELSADEFYNDIRPFLSGWGGASSSLPNGLIYEGVSPEPQQLAGGSAAQSSTLHCIDAALGIHHEKDKREFLLSMRDMMPRKHVAFIEALENGPSIKSFVSTCRDEKLTEIYNAVIDKLRDFRTYHIQIVTKYIITVRSKQKEHNSLANTGTGGTSILPFLKSIRSSTSSTKFETS